MKIINEKKFENKKYKIFNFKFSCKKTNFSTFSDSNVLLVAVTVFPAVENSHSLVACVVGTEMYRTVASDDIETFYCSPSTS